MTNNNCNTKRLLCLNSVPLAAVPPNGPACKLSFAPRTLKLSAS